MGADRRVGEVVGEAVGEGVMLGFRRARTTMINFWPFWHLPGTPLMKKKGPDLPNLKTVWPLSCLSIGLAVAHDW